MPELHAQGLSVTAEHGLPPLSPTATEQPWRENTNGNLARGAPTGLLGRYADPHGSRAGPSGVTARGYGPSAPSSGSRATAATHRAGGGAHRAGTSSQAHGRSAGPAGTSPAVPLGTSLASQHAVGRALARVASGPRMGSVLGVGAGGPGARAADRQLQRRQLNAGPSRPARGRGLADSDSSSDDGVVGSAGLRFGRAAGAAGVGAGTVAGGLGGGFQERFLADMRRREAEREQLAALLLPQGEDELLRQAEDAQLAMALMLSMQDAGMTPPALSNPPSHRNSSSYASDANRGAHAASPAPRPQPDLHHPHHPFLPSSHPLAATLGLGQGLGLGPASGLPQGAPLALLGLGPGGGGGWAGGGLAAAAAALLRGVEYGGYGDMAGVVGGLGGLGGGAGVASEDGGGGGALSYEALLQLEDVKVTTPQEVLDALPRSTFAGPRDGGESACAICQSDYAGGEELVRLPCCHVLHWACAEQWLGGYSRKCPVCKYDVCG